MMIAEAIAAIVLSLILAWSAGTYVVSETEINRSEQTFNALLMRARSTAPEQSDGLTVIIAPSATGTLVSVVQGRPESGTTEGTLAGVQLPLPVTVTVNGSTTAALLVDPTGRVTVAAPWTPWQTMSSQPAACSTATVALSVGQNSSTYTLSCVDGTLP